MKKPIRYIRIENNDNTTSINPYTKAYWAEIEVVNSDGENVLLGKLPMNFSSDGYNSVYNRPERFTDGNRDMYEYGFSNYVTFVKYDLGEIHTDLEKILVFQYISGSKYAKVSVSVDNLTWETIFESYETITGRTTPNYYEAIVPEVDDFSTPDTTPPNFDYIQDLTLEYGAEFDPLHNVVALDDRDGDITNRMIVIGSVNTSMSGEYLLTYIVADKSGNMATKERKVTVGSKDNIIASVELQKALFTLLSSGDCPVFEVVPKDEGYPYITFRIQSKLNNQTKTALNRQTFNVYVHSWSQSSSSLESKTMDSFIHDAIMGKWQIDGYEVELVELAFGETLTETDVTNNIFQGIQEFEITISKK